MASAATLASVLILTSHGQAGAAPNVTGQTYADASSALSGAGLKAIVAATVGDRLSKNKCLVVSQRNESVAQRGSHSTAGTTVALSLNCDNQPASATKPGFSAASPQGRAAKAAAAASAAAKPTR
jgi:PASTA domain